MRDRLSLAQIAARNLDIAVLGQVPSMQLALHDKLESGPLEMERLHATLGRRWLFEEALEGLAGRSGRCPRIGRG
jgi:hypothetical protein